MARPVNIRFSDFMPLLKEGDRRLMLLMASELTSTNEMIIAELIASDSDFLSSEKTMRLFKGDSVKQVETQREIILRKEKRSHWSAETGDVFYFNEGSSIPKQTLNSLMGCTCMKGSRLFIINMTERDGGLC